MTEPSLDEALARAVAKLAIGRQQRHIFLCVAGGKCAPVARSEESWDYLKRRFRELGLVDVDGGVMRTKAHCLRVCVGRTGRRRLSGRHLVPQAAPPTISSASCRNT